MIYKVFQQLSIGFGYLEPLTRKLKLHRRSLSQKIKRLWD